VKTEKVFKVSKTDEAVRKRILHSATALFLCSGFIRVTADEIAGSLGISKATLYRQFASKDDILRGVVRAFMDETLGRVEAILAAREDGLVERLAKLFAFLSGQMTVLGPFLVRDMRRHAPDLWAEVEDFRREKILNNVSRLLEDGVREGVFRRDLDRELTLQFFMTLVQEHVNPEALDRAGRSARNVFDGLIRVFFGGILTDGARREFERRISHGQASR